MKLKGAWLLKRARRWRRYYSRRDYWTYISCGSGKVLVSQAAWRTELEPGARVVLPAGRAFDLEVTDNAVTFFIVDFQVFPARSGDDPLTRIGLPAMVPPVGPDGDADNQERVLVLVDSRKVLEARAHFEVCLVKYLAEGFASGILPRQPTLPAPDWLVATRNYLVQQFAKPVDLAALARHIGVSESHLSHEFRNSFGTTPIEFLYRERLTNAAHFLSADRDSTIEAIARRCGFPDQGHFTRRFRRQYGVTPSQWRRNEHARC